MVDRLVTHVEGSEELEQMMIDNLEENYLKYIPGSK